LRFHKKEESTRISEMGSNFDFSSTGTVSQQGIPFKAILVREV
jgi:hypothetical protein